MSSESVLPFDIITEIIDTVGENKDTNFLKKLALVSHSFLHICSKYLYATVELHDAAPSRHIASSKKGFVKLLRSRPDVVRYIRKLTYRVEYHSLHHLSSYPNFDDDDHLLSFILPYFHRTISRLNCLRITVSLSCDWNSLSSSLASAFLRLMHLPTINHIDLSFIGNFPLSSLTPSVNLHRLDLSYMMCFDSEDGSPEIVASVQSEMPKILELNTSESSLLTSELLHAETRNGQPAFNFMDLRRISFSFNRLEDERNIRYLLQNAKLLEQLRLSVRRDRSLVDILSLSACTVKSLDLKVSLYDVSLGLPLAGLCEELEAMAGHNMVETLFCEVQVERYETEDYIGSIIQKVEKVLVEPGWSALRQVSFEVRCRVSLYDYTTSMALVAALQSLPDKYLSHLSKLESIAFNYSVYTFHTPWLMSKRSCRP